MKYARPLLIGTLAFAITSILIALALATSTLWVVPSTAVSAIPMPTVWGSTYVASLGTAAGTPTPADTGTPLPTDEPTADTPTPIPFIAPPTPPTVSSAAFQQGMMLRTNGDYAHAADSFRAALKDKPDAALARQAHFRLGEALWLSGDDAGASKELSAVIAADDTDNLAARAHYFLAQVMQNQKNYSEALAHLRAYRKQTKTLQGEIDGAIGDLLLLQGNGAAALAQYNTALQDSTLTPAQRVDLLDKLSDAYRTLGQPAQAAARLGEAFNLAPDAATAAHLEYKWGLALDAAGQHSAAVGHWQHTVNTYPDQGDAYNALVTLVDANEPVDDFQRGLVDYNHGAYDVAILAFNRFIQANPEQNATALYYLGRAYLQTNAYAPAVRNLDTLLQSYPNDRHAADAAYYKAQAITGSGDTAGGVAAYNQFAASYPNDARADDAMYQAARNLDAGGRSSEAQAQYRKFVSAYPNSPYAPTALFDIGLDDYLANNTASAEAAWRTLATSYPDTTGADQANFWLGKLAQARGDKQTAQTLFQAAAKPPRSYFSYRALDVIAPFNEKPAYTVSAYRMGAQPNEIAEFEKWLASWTGGAPVSSQLTPAVLADFYFRRGSELAQLDQAGEAHVDFEKVNARFKTDPRSLYALAIYYQQNNYFDLSISTAQQILALAGAANKTPRYLRELIYPTYYADLVVPYAQQYGFDPALFFALMRQESTFNPRAISWVGATGLTQVMPATGAGIARDLGVQRFQTDDLSRPYTSVRFGTYFFGQLARMFDGNIFYTLAGYNGGPGNAKRWQRPDVDVAVELIPLSQSAVYVRTVYLQYNQYLEIYRGR
ncbi:MAG: transglycosylase SLT domain-containing protein [Anaerolineae bacterium]